MWDCNGQSVSTWVPTGRFLRESFLRLYRVCAIWLSAVACTYSRHCSFAHLRCVEELRVSQHSLAFISIHSLYTVCTCRDCVWPRSLPRNPRRQGSYPRPHSGTAHPFVFALSLLAPPAPTTRSLRHWHRPDLPSSSSDPCLAIGHRAASTITLVPAHSVPRLAISHASATRSAPLYHSVIGTGRDFVSSKWELNQAPLQIRPLLSCDGGMQERTTLRQPRWSCK
jgi:hypothetical protein